MKKYIVAIIALLFIAGSACAGDNFSYSGYLKNETSVRVNHFNNDLTKFKNIAEVAGEYKANDYLAFFTKAKYWYDAAYDWRKEYYDKNQHYMGHVQRADWLRDCYLDYTKDPWFLRLGKQQVAWGQADGITILDRVNPLDLTEYWLPDFVDLRIPLWMANINYSPKLNSNLQLLIIPDFEQSTSAPAYSPFAFRSLNLFENGNQAAGWLLGVDTFFPGKQFDNSTFALQWQDRIGDLEYTLNYLYGYYYSARLVSTPNPLYYIRSFKLWRMYGGSFNKTFTNPGPLQGVTLRGDFAYYNDEPTYYGLDGSRQGFERWNNVFWLIGADRSVATNWLISFQFAQYIMEHAKPHILNYRPLNAYTYGLQDQVENIFTLKISTDFMHERLKPEVLWSLTDDNQGRLSPKFTYELRDNLWLTVGVHYFYGKEQDTNGQFNEQNQLYTQLKYTF